MIFTTKQNLRNYILEINRIDSRLDISKMAIFKWYVKKEKAVYTTMNKLALESHIFYGFLWCPLPKHQIMREIYSL